MQFVVSLAVLISFSAVDFPVAHAVAVRWPALSLAGVLLSQLLIPLVAIAITGRTLADMNSGHFEHGRILERLDRGYLVHHFAWIVVGSGVLMVSGWIALVTSWWETFGLAQVPLLVRLSVVVPVLLPLLLSWACFYEAERVVDQSVAKQTRRQFVIQLVRANLLLPLIVVASLVGWVEIIEWLFPENDSSILRIAPLLLLMPLFPWLLRIVWSLKRLPSGLLREQLKARMRASNVECRDILVWRTGGRFRNAAMTGFFRRFRFVLLSDRLIDDLEPKAVECVLLHELGHAYHRHSLKLLLSILLVQAPGLIWLSQLSLPNNGLPLSPELALTAAIAFLIGLGFFVGLWLTSRLARLMEHQADVWAANAFGDVDVYLEALSMTSGMDPEATTWLHPSFVERRRVLLQASEKTRSWLQVRFSRLWVLILTFGVVGPFAASVLSLHWWQSL